jgi:archaellum component FlaC
MVENILRKLTEKFGQDSPLTTSRYMDGNILPEQFTDVDATHMENNNNQLPSEIEAVEEYTEGHTDQQPKATEAIEDKMASTTDDKNEMNEIDERTQDTNNLNEDINDDVQGNNNEATEEIEDD